MLGNINDVKDRSVVIELKRPGTYVRHRHEIISPS